MILYCTGESNKVFEEIRLHRVAGVVFGGSPPPERRVLFEQRERKGRVKVDYLYGIIEQYKRIKDN